MHFRALVEPSLAYRSLNLHRQTIQGGDGLPASARLAPELKVRQPAYAALGNWTTSVHFTTSSTFSR
jgi:hypothetical protein